MPARPPDSGQLLTLARRVLGRLSRETVADILKAPVIIVSAPRSGSNLLFEQLSRTAGFWTIGGESHGVFRAFPGLRAENAELDSGRLDAAHADPETCDLMRACFLLLLRNHAGEPYLQTTAGDNAESVVFLEKTPRNALNVPFLLELFPGARFIYLHRDPRHNIASLVEAWQVGLQTGRFVTFRRLPGWDRSGWCFVLPPGWRSLVGKSLVDIAAFQWAETNRIVLDDLGKLDRQRWVAASYEELVARPGRTLRALCEFAGVDAPLPIGGDAPMPLSRTTLSPPDPDKWRKHEAAINSLLPQLAAIRETIETAVSPP